MIIIITSLISFSWIYKKQCWSTWEQWCGFQVNSLRESHENSNHRIKSGRRHGDVTRWFAECCFQTSSLALWPTPSWFFWPWLTIIGGEVGAGEDTHRYASILIGSDWNPEDVVATCQTQCSYALKHTLLFRLFFSKWDHIFLLNILKKDLKQIICNQLSPPPPAGH